MNNVQTIEQPTQNLNQPMQQAPKQDNDSKKIFTMLVLVFTLMICTTGATYAYFALSATNNVMTGTAATANLTLTVQTASLKSNTGVMVPQLESTLGTAMNSTNQCVDANGNMVCKAYTITVTNGSSAGVKVKGTISFANTDTSMINLKWKRTDSATAVSSTTTGSYSSTNTSVCTLNAAETACSTFPEYDLTAGTTCTTSDGTDVGCTSISLTKYSTSTTTDSATYYVVIWINETNEIQTDSGTWKATIKFEGENGTGVTSTIKG